MIYLGIKKTRVEMGAKIRFRRQTRNDPPSVILQIIEFA